MYIPIAKRVLSARNQATDLQEIPGVTASLRSVPEWGREILPSSIPEIVVGLIPASPISRTWVHIRHSRKAARFLPVRLLAVLFPMVTLPRHIL